jgi:hypothetical protein
MGKQRAGHGILYVSSYYMPDLDAMVDETDELDFCRQAYHFVVHSHHWFCGTGWWNKSTKPEAKLPELLSRCHAQRPRHRQRTRQHKLRLRRVLQRLQRHQRDQGGVNLVFKNTITNTVTRTLSNH